MVSVNSGKTKKALIKWGKSILLISLLVIFSILHKVNSYSIITFDFTLVVYIVIWILVLTMAALLPAFIFKGRKSYIGVIVYLGFFTLNFGEIQDFFFYTLHSKFLASTWTLAGILLISLIAGFIYYRRKPVKLTKTFDFFLFLFVILSIVEIFMLLYRPKIGRYDVYRTNRKLNTMKPVTTAKKPDIYYVVFDSYTSNAALKTHWGFSNDSINAFLSASGFKISGNAHSSYDFTPLSVNSVFNLGYLEASDQSPRDFILFNYGRKAFDTAFILKWFRGQGYEINCYSMLSAAYDPDKTYPFNPDKPLHWLRRQTIERIWLNPWLWNRFLSVTGRDNAYPAKIESAIRTIRNNTQSLLNTVMQQDKSPVPKFIYAHFLLPHEPYLYKRDGSARPANEVFELTAEQDKQFYLDQVYYSNRLITKIVSHLLATGADDKIIIIQGDHGYRNYTGKEKGDRLGVFNAIYFPRKEYEQVGDSMQLVNTFRIVLNNYFDQQLPLLQPADNKAGHSND